MFNDSMQGISVLTYSLFNSAVDIIKENTFESVISDKAQFVSDIGDIYFPMSEGVGLNRGETPLPTFMIDGDDTNCELIDYQNYSRSYINQNITTINYNKSIFLPTLLKQLALNEKTYGVIIQKGDYMINPLHPAIAFSITSGLLEYPDEGELHIFEWSDDSMDQLSSMSNRKKKKEMDFFESEYSKIFASFKHLIKKPIKETRKAKITENNIKRLIESPLIEDIDIKIDVSLDNESSNTNGIKSILVPTQLAIGNMAQPYYGFMFIDYPTSSSIIGYNMSPMMSGNLQQDMGNVTRYRSLQNAAESGNVCTGSSNSRTSNGWMTLSKVNLNSMFNAELVSTTGLLNYVETSKKIAGAIWTDVEASALAEIEEATDVQE